MYYAIIGDMINSRNIGDRYAAQVKLHAVLENINHLFNDDIASDFIITLGDEFQGVLHNAANMMEITDRIKFQMNPNSITIWIGIGEISTPVDRKQASAATVLPIGMPGKQLILLRSIKTGL